MSELTREDVATLAESARLPLVNELAKALLKADEALRDVVEMVQFNSGDFFRALEKIARAARLKELEP